MHKIFVTNGIVLWKRGVGEANTQVAILTDELGLVRVSARSARLWRSKLRYGLEPLTRARFSLVRGRHEWKLTGVERVSRDYVMLRECSPSSVQNVQAIARVARLLLRLIHGEMPMGELFASVTAGFDHISNADSVENVEASECLLVLRILHHLGYIPHTNTLTPFLSDDSFSEDVILQAVGSRSLLIITINNAIAETGL